ncbi:MAG: hypothetical protein HY801_06680 [Candidatus Lindowbacteria bacterium]|nr:hypothetical protein [Candidatus Lindowbacteria bacterium]
MKPDVHFRRGIGCIDCHDSVDLHGDGNIYSHQEYQVGIRCESCHGGPSKRPAFRTERGDPLRNVVVIGAKPYLRTKILEEEHIIPVLHTSAGESPEPAPIWHDGHEKLECYACHSASMPQCFGCHMVRDDSRMSPVDWAAGVGEGEPPDGEPPKSSLGGWSGQSLYQEWDNPVLGVNRRGRASPFIPGGQAILTHLDLAGDRVGPDHTFTTSAGLYGFSMSPVQPHNISSESRTCSSCHSSKKTMGLGTEFADLKRLGIGLNFPPDRLVNEDGGRIQDSGHEGVRPFNGEELATLLRTDFCILCHERSSETRQWRFAPGSLKEADRLHKEAIQKAFQAGKE